MTRNLVCRRRSAASLFLGCLLAAAPEARAAQPFTVERLSAPAADAGAPTALVAGDFDEDGRLDLVVGATAGSRSSLTVMSASRPGAAEPFGPPLATAASPVAPRWLAAGDFDADGHLDLAVGAPGEAALYWLRGDGSGRLEDPRTVELPGGLDAWTSGEVNRRDGLEDLAVGVSAPDGPLLLVFEAARGAFSEPPEAHALPAPARAIALARMGGGPWRDVAVASGSDVVVFEGRDRKLALSPAARARVPAARSERLAFAGPVEGLTAADLVPDALGRSELRVRVQGGREVVLQRRVTDPTQEAPPQAAPAPVAVSAASAAAQRPAPRRNLAGTPEARAEAAPLSARSAAPSPAHPAWLEVAGEALARRAALLDPETLLRRAGGPIGAGEPLAALPLRLGTDGLPDLVLAARDGLSAIVTKAAATFTVNSTNDTNDGTCDAGHCSLREAILAANATTDADQIAFAISGTGPHTIALTALLPIITQPVTIDGYTQNGASESTDAAVFDGTVEIVLDGGAIAASGDQDALAFDGSATGSVVRGLSIVDFPDDGIESFAGSVTVEGNLIGLLPDGSTVGSLGGTGVQLFSNDNQVGGTAPAARNVISGTQVHAIEIADASGNVVEGNLVGTDAGGTVSLGQTTFAGVMVNGANDNTVGGTATGARNVIGGSGQSGVCLCNFDATPPLSTGNLVQGNRIGTNAAGTAALPNGLDGVASQDAGGNTVGGTATGAGNLLSGNDQNGVFLSHFGIGPSDGGVVQGNFIGTDVSGTSAIPNSAGVLLFESASLNTIGGAAAGAGNLISGNGGAGVILDFNATTGSGVSGNLVAGNLIGTDAAGTSPLANGFVGVSLQDATLNTVSGNTIAFNTSSGVYLDSTEAASTDNEIGQNVIAENGFDGVSIFGDATVRNRVTENEVFGNTQLAVDLVDTAGTLAGATANDPDDPDTGPNQLQNFPAFNAAPPGATSLSGTLDSTPSASFTVELFAVAICDPSDHGEADVFLGSAVANTDASGDGTFAFALGSAVSEGDLFTATATDADGNTSELSACRESCVEVQDLAAQTVSTAETVTACETITAGDGGFEVASAGDLTLRAGSSVVLESGFSVASGGRLEIRVEPRLSTPP